MRNLADDSWRMGSILLGVLVCLLFFLGKPVHMDDPVYLWVAQHIQQHPADFYGGFINWNGTIERVSDFMMNPPGISYYLAAAAAVVGWSETALHAAMLIPALGAVLGIYCFAREMCDRPALATAIAVFSPVFILSATTLMCDVGMVCLFTWGLFLWVRGIRENENAWLMGAAVLILLGALTKYFGASLIPLLAVYTLALRRRFDRRVFWLVIPIAGLAAYELYTRHLYGMGLFTNAAHYSSDWRAKLPGADRPHLLTGLAFTGGCLLTAVPGAVAVLWGNWRSLRRWKWAAASGFATALLATFFADVPFIKRLHMGRAIGAGEMIQLVIFSVGGWSLLVLAARELLHWRESDSLLLGLGIWGTFIFVIALNWTVSARTVLPMAPLAGVMVARRVESMRTVRIATWGVVALAWVGPLLAHADEEMARSARDAAELVTQNIKGRVLWFQGHWGFQYYMQKLGAREVDVATTVCNPGDVMMVAEKNSNVYEVPLDAVTRVGKLSLYQPNFIASQDWLLGAGFYSDASGPLPFAFGRGVTDEYSLYRVDRRIRYVAVKK